MRNKSKRKRERKRVGGGTREKDSDRLRVKGSKRVKERERELVLHVWTFLEKAPFVDNAVDVDDGNCVDAFQRKKSVSPTFSIIDVLFHLSIRISRFVKNFKKRNIVV